MKKVPVLYKKFDGIKLWPIIAKIFGFRQDFVENIYFLESFRENMYV